MINNFKACGIAAVLLSVPFSVSAQTTINGGRTITGAWDASKAVSSKPAKTGATLPTTCGVGEIFFNTSAAQGQNLFFCTAQNTWIQMTGGNSGGSSSNSSNSSTPNVLLYKGDLSGYSNQNVRIPVGTDGSSLVADSTQGSGLRYRNASDSDLFANRPVCTPALTGQTYFPTDGILGYRCNGSAWTAFGPIAPITPMRLANSNGFGVVGTGSSVLTAAATVSGNLSVLSCASLPTTVGMILVDSEVIAGTCSGTTFTPIAGGRGYNQTTPGPHNVGATVVEQLFVWADTSNGVSTQGASTVAANAGYLALTANGGGNGAPVLVKPVPNGVGSSYTVTAGFIMNGIASGDQGCGVGFRQSSNHYSAVVLFHTITYTQTGFNIGFYQEIDGNFTGAYFNDLAAAVLTGNGMYFRLQDTGVFRNVYVSSDGINFALAHSVANTDFLTADQIMITCTPGATPQMGSFYSWSETN